MAATKLRDRTCKNCSVIFQGWNCSTVCSTECHITHNISLTSKTCTKCKENKDIENFYIQNEKTQSRKAHCSKCEQEVRKKAIANNPNYDKQITANRKKKWGQAYPEKLRNSRLKSVYGIDNNRYAEILDFQNGVCAICHETETKMNKEQNIPKRLAVDHCHSTGKVRGLLCFDCNSSLGKFKDSIENLYNAIDYLNKSREPVELNLTNIENCVIVENDSLIKEENNE